MALPQTPDAEGATTRRTVAYGGLALLLGGGLAARLTGSVLATGAADMAHHRLLPFASLDPAQAEAAVAASAIPPAQRPAVLAAVRERRMHLIEAPFFGTGDTVGRTVTVSCGLVTVPLVLGSMPKAVLLPITRAATIVVARAGTALAGATIGVVTAIGPQPLPAPDVDHVVQIDVIVQ